MILAGTWGATAQDIHFSQYFVAPLAVNPALTGFMDGTARASVNHKSQWSSVNNAFVTDMVSADGIILQGRIPSSDRFGVGVMGVSDRIADGLLVNNSLSISTAYHKGLDKEGKFSVAVGLQGSYSNRSLNGTQLRMNDQLDDFGNFSVPSRDAIQGRDVSKSSFDVSAGLLFKARLDEKSQFYIGVSMYHLAQPKATFMNDVSLKVPMRTSISGGIETKFSEMLNVSLVGIHSRQETASETVVGGIVTIGKSYREYEKSLSGYLGVLYRVNDAFIPYVAAEYADVRVGFSYDLNTSGLNDATKGQGGAELSIVYLLRIPPNKKIIYLCPNNPKF